MKKILLSSALLLSTFQVQANQSYVGLDFGIARFDISDDIEDNAQTYANDVGGTVQYEYQKGSGFTRIFLGHRYTDNIEFEIGYLTTSDIDTKYSVISGTNSGEKIEATDTVSGFDFGVNFFINENLFLRGGLHNATIQSEAKKTGSSGSVLASVNGSDSGTNMFFGAGYKQDFNNDFSWRLGYSYYNNLAGVSALNVSVISAGLLLNF